MATGAYKYSDTFLYRAYASTQGRFVACKCSVECIVVCTMFLYVSVHMDGTLDCELCKVFVANASDFVYKRHFKSLHTPTHRQPYPYSLHVQNISIQLQLQLNSICIDKIYYICIYGMHVRHVRTEQNICKNTYIYICMLRSIYSIFWCTSMYAYNVKYLVVVMESYRYRCTRNEMMHRICEFVDCTHKTQLAIAQLLCTKFYIVHIYIHISSAHIVAEFSVWSYYILAFIDNIHTMHTKSGGRRVGVRRIQ